MSTLYELKKEYEDLIELVENGDIDMQTFADTIEGIDFEIEIKAENYAKVIKEMQGKELILKAEIDRLSEKKYRIMNSVKVMKERLEMTMKATGKVKFKTDLFSFSIQKNGGVQPMQIVGEVPEEYCMPEPDNKKIREALESGKQLEFAVLSERGESLRIR